MKYLNLGNSKTSTTKKKNRKEMDNRNCGHIWQRGFTLSQSDEYHHHHYHHPIENASIPVLRDPIRDATTSSFLFWDYDPTFRTNIEQTVSSNFTGPHCIVPLSQIPVQHLVRYFNQY